MRAALRSSPWYPGSLGECTPFVCFAKAHQLPPYRRVTSESLVSKRVTNKLCVAEWEGLVFPWSYQLGPGLKPSQQWLWFIKGLDVSRSCYESGLERTGKIGFEKEDCKPELGFLRLISSVYFIFSLLSLTLYKLIVSCPPEGVSF